MAIYQKIIIDPRFEKLPLKKLILTSFVLNLIIIVLGLLAQFILPPEIPLLFGLPQTTEQLTPSIYIILPSIIALIISVSKKNNIWCQGIESIIISNDLDKHIKEYAEKWNVKYKLSKEKEYSAIKNFN